MNVLGQFHFCPVCLAGYGFTAQRPYCQHLQPSGSQRRKRGLLELLHLQSGRDPVDRVSRR